MAIAELWDNGELRALTTGDLGSGAGGVSPSDPLFVELTAGDAEVSSTNRLQVEVLGIPSVARQIAATTASANTALTSTCKRVSLLARKADIRYSVGSTAQTASATTSHFLGIDERIEIALPATANIAIVRDTEATQNGVLEVTELV